MVVRGHRVVALHMRQGMPTAWQGVECVRYGARRNTTTGVHPWVGDFETKVIRGEACYHAAVQLRSRGFVPDVIVAHPGWGESLFLKEVWPSAKLGIFCEFFYQLQGADVGFDAEFSPTDPHEACRLRMKNASSLMHLDLADAGIAPTAWQASTFPALWRDKITVVHDGIDTQAVSPDRNARMVLDGVGTLSCADEVITFVARNLEPYRGYHVFMRALPALLRQRPQARVLIVGANGTSYGASPSSGTTWQALFAGEARAQMPVADWARVHFCGQLPYAQFMTLLQISTVHVYLTYPFVLSWSLLEAMSVGCAIVASKTTPVQEAIAHGETGRLVDFFDGQALVQEVCTLLESPDLRQRVGAAARSSVVARYDLKTVCLPRQLEWIEGLA